MQTTMTDKTIRLPDGRHLGYAEYGDPEGVPLLFFHGTPGSRLQLKGFDAPARNTGVWHHPQLPGDLEAEALPAGGDCYCLRQILHDWNDEHCLQILRNIRQAIRPTGRLLIFERVIQPSPSAVFNTFFDLQMLALLEGRERTPHEYEQLLRACGFHLAAIRPTPSAYSIVEGMPL